MSSLLEPLKIMICRRQSVIAKASLQFFSAESRQAGFLVELQAPKLSNTIEYSAVGDAIDNTAIDERRGTQSHTVQEPMIVEMAFGIRLDICQENHASLNVSKALIHADVENPIKNTLHHFRLFPDWQTSYLWYDLTKRTDMDDPYVDFDDIEERYPSFAPYYEAWRQVYETQFEKAECHLGSGAEVFSDLDDRIAWDVEGFFLACWLVLRSDVQSVEYMPRSTKYIIEKGTIENVLLELLQDITTEKKSVERG